MSKPITSKVMLSILRRAAGDTGYRNKLVAKPVTRLKEMGYEPHPGAVAVLRSIKSWRFAPKPKKPGRRRPTEKGWGEA